MVSIHLREGNDFENESLFWQSEIFHFNLKFGFTETAVRSQSPAKHSEGEVGEATGRKLAEVGLGRRPRPSQCRLSLHFLLLLTTLTYQYRKKTCRLLPFLYN